MSSEPKTNKLWCKRTSSRSILNEHFAALVNMCSLKLSPSQASHWWSSHGLKLGNDPRILNHVYCTNKNEYETFIEHHSSLLQATVRTCMRLGLKRLHLSVYSGCLWSSLRLAFCWRLARIVGKEHSYCVCNLCHCVLSLNVGLPALIHMSQSTSVSHAAVPANSSLVSLNFSSFEYGWHHKTGLPSNCLPTSQWAGVVSFGLRHKYHHTLFSSSACHSVGKTYTEWIYLARNKWKNKVLWTKEVLLFNLPKDKSISEVSLSTPAWCAEGV